ncbi:MAG TPA: FHA domain-containing protein [Ktedonobacteraceae bacterium]|nr:FHA domain-containing protein [Ktedonobacteraceae bacterium]
MDKCPFCSAETRPGDNFCLNCGNRLQTSTPSPQAPTAMSDATLPAPAEWTPPVAQGSNPDNTWNNPDLLTIVADPADSATMRSGTAPQSPQAAPAVMNKIEEPAHLILRADNNEVLNDYTLDKYEMSIGRAPNSDILLSKDKLTSRRHATILYENGQYSIRDERSANGTFVNSQQLDESAVRPLQNGDHIGIGEHELVFQTAQSSSSGVDIESLPTMTVSASAAADMTYRTQEDANITTSSDDEYGTRSMNGGSNVQQVSPQQDDVPVTPAPVPVAPAPDPSPVATENAAPAASSQKSIPDDVWQTPSQSPSAPLEANAGVTFSRLTSLPQPGLPDVTPLTAALAALDGQVASLQEQLNTTQEAMRSHEADILSTTNQLRSGVRSVSDRMDKTIADVARTREQLAWSELLQLMEDVMNNPRDIEYVIKLARKARELNKVFQIHQNVLSTLAECTSLLRSLVGEDR